MFPSTVASPAPTCSIAWCQKTRSKAKKIPASQASPRALSGRGPYSRFSRNDSAQSGGSAQTQR